VVSRPFSGNYHIKAHFELGVGPSWDLNHHVQDLLAFVSKQGDIVEWRDWGSISFWKLLVGL
jgi:hypothetical protein